MLNLLMRQQSAPRLRTNLRERRACAQQERGLLESEDTERGIGKMGLGMMTVQLAQSKIGYDEDEEIRHANHVSARHRTAKKS